MKTIEVVAAVIIKDNKIFATQRGYGQYKDWWEFPGGKIEKDETPEKALIREIKEELLADILIQSYLCTIEHDYPEFHLIMHCYICDLISHNLTLVEHESSRWLSIKELDEVNWLPADLKVIDELKELLCHEKYR